MKIKAGRYEVNVDNNDMILDNGSCYQIITQHIRRGFDKITPRLSQKAFNDLKKKGLIVKSNVQYKDYFGIEYTSYTLWRFDLEDEK